jgi:hypothetical protein
VNPPICSLASAYGPSVIDTSPPPARTTVADRASVRVAKKTHAPAAFNSSWCAATRAMIIRACSGEGGSAPSSWKTDNR